MLSKDAVTVDTKVRWEVRRGGGVGPWMEWHSMHTPLLMGGGDGEGDAATERGRWWGGGGDDCDKEGEATIETGKGVW